MTTLPRNILLGSLVMLAALGAASCSSEDTGQTLSVTAVPNSPQTVNSNTDIKATPIVTYKGKKDLEFNWSLNLPVGGQATITEGATRQATFNFKNPGTYGVVLFVQQSGGTISESSTGTYIVKVNPVTANGIDVTIPVTVSASGNPNPATAISQTGTLTLTISGGVSPYTVVWDNQVTSGNPSLTLAGTTQTTTGTGATKTVVVRAFNGASTQTFIASGSVTDANGVQATFQIGIIVLITTTA